MFSHFTYAMRHRNKFRSIMGLMFFAFFVFAPVSGHSAPRYAHIVIDGHTGKTLTSQNAHAKRYPASLTKVMTLYILFEEMKAGRLKPWSRLKASHKAAMQPPSKIGIRKGQNIIVRDAIKALVVKSANDVATVVAENIAGSEWNFAKRMTATARRLGMSKTQFRNASGLPDKRQFTTARDMARLGLKIRAHFPQYAHYFKIKSFTWQGKKFRSHNRLLWSYSGSTGMKTGYIRASGYNLTTSAHRGKKYLMAVVIGGKSAKRRNNQMISLLDRSWRKATNQKPKRVAKAVPTKPTPVPVRKASAAGLPGAKGDWFIQVGAFIDKQKAIHRLKELQKNAGPVLRGKKPVAEYHGGNGMSFYRARFAGFSQSSASKACHYLISKSVSCYALAK